MQKLKKQIEGQIQEIVFFFSLLLSFTVFITGIFFLVLTPESATYILGGLGTAITGALFSVFGFAFFYIAVMALHMGYVTNMHVFNFKDLKREYQVLSISAVAHFIILMMFATVFSVVQIYFEIPNGELLHNGSGGLIGTAFGQLLFSVLGVYGSVSLLIAGALGTSIFAGFFEVNDIIEIAKDSVHAAKKSAITSTQKFGKNLLSTLQFGLRDHRVATATVGFSASKSWVSHSMSKANAFIADHANPKKWTEHFDRKTTTKEKATVKKAASKKTQSKSAKVNTLKTLTIRKSKKKIAAVAKKAKKDVLGLAKR